MKYSRFTVITEGKEKFEYDIVDAKITVGRDVKNDIVVHDSKVSRTHCYFVLRDGLVRIKDNNSKNHLFVNGIKQTEALLSDGDKIKLGNSTLEVVLSCEDNIDAEEETIEFAIFSHVVFQDERTQEDVSFNELSGSDGVFLPAIDDKRRRSSTFFSFMIDKRNYLLATSLFVGTTVMFVFGHDKQQSEVTIPVNNSLSTEKSTIVEDKNELVVSSGDVSPESKEKARALIAEAESLDSIGQYKKSLNKYNEALAVDPDNSLAKIRLDKARKKIDELARSYFDSGVMAYNSLEYGDAIDYWKNVLFLLEDNKDSKLYKDATSSIAQARAKLNE